MLKVIYNGNPYQLTRLPAQMPLPHAIEITVNSTKIPARVNDLETPTMFTIGDSSFEIARAVLWPGYIALFAVVVGLLFIVFGYLAANKYILLLGVCIVAPTAPFGIAWFIAELITRWRYRRVYAV